MHRSTWKARERQVAKMFQAQRNSLSGSNSKMSSSDSTHPRLYIECKVRTKDALWTLHDDTKKKAIKESKTPILAIMRKGSPGSILCVHSDNLEAFVSEWLIANNGSSLVLSHQLPDGPIPPSVQAKRQPMIEAGRKSRIGKDKLLPTSLQRKRKRKKGKLS